MPNMKSLSISVLDTVYKPSVTYTHMHNITTVETTSFQKESKGTKIEARCTKIYNQLGQAVSNGNYS